MKFEEQLNITLKTVTFYCHAQQLQNDTQKKAAICWLAETPNQKDKVEMRELVVETLSEKKPTASLYTGLNRSSNELL